MKVSLPLLPAGKTPDSGLINRVFAAVSAAFERVQQYAVVPPGGTAGSVLTKVDARNFNTDWSTPAQAIPFSASNFSANGSMTWTVASTGQYGYWYSLVGKQLTLAFMISGTVGGVVNTELRINLPAGLSSSSTHQSGAPIRVASNGVNGIGWAQTSIGGGTFLSCYVDATAASNWAAGAAIAFGQVEILVN